MLFEPDYNSLLASAEEVIVGAWLAGIEPTPDLSVSDWSDRYRILAGRHSAEAGPWKTSRTPYLREIMDHLSLSSRAERVVLMKGAQIGATEAGNNWVGYVIHHAPGPMLYIEPTVDAAKKASRLRLAPMISSSPELSVLVAEAKTRYGSNTILQKEFPGGVLTITGANSAVGLRHLSARYLFADEVDGYPPDVGKEGDPLDLAIKRTDTFSGARKIFMCSTPTTKGFSRIETAFEESDQRRYQVPCPHCGSFQSIEWANIKWPEGVPSDAALVCVECKDTVYETSKERMLSEGRWVATAEGDGRTIGYHLSALYSPLGWYSWGNAARDFVSAKERGREAMKTWVNTVLGETWEEEGQAVDEDILSGRSEQYPPGCQVPAGALVLTCGVDVQDDRVELEVVGWGPGEESWGIRYRSIWGDPGGSELWAELAEALGETFDREGGGRLGIACACIDSGGHYTQQVYRFCRGRQSQRVFAIKGMAGSGRPLVEAPKHRRTGREQRHVELFMIGTDQARGIVQSRLRLSTVGPGYCHWPVGNPGYGDEYRRQLTSLRSVTRYTRGIPKREWVLMPHRRKEAFDCRVYALAALYILNPIWEKIAKRKVEDGPAPETEIRPTPRPQPRPVIQGLRLPRKNWMNSWK
jgi:phage terminase large subunit GpA-like protein